MYIDRTLVAYFAVGAFWWTCASFIAKHFAASFVEDIMMAYHSILSVLCYNIVCHRVPCHGMV